MSTFEEAQMRPFIEAVEETLECRIGDTQIQAALAVAQGEIAIVPDRADALPIAALAAATLTASGTHKTIHLVTTTVAEAERLTPLFLRLGLAATVTCAPAEKFVFDSLKGKTTHDTTFGMIVDAERVLLHEGNTPVILARPNPEPKSAVSDESQEKADRLLQKGRDYIVQEGTILIRDPETGELFPDRRFSDGMHAAIQKREGLAVEAEGEILAQTRISDHFRTYTTLGGTAPTPNERYQTEYGLQVSPL